MERQEALKFDHILRESGKMANEMKDVYNSNVNLLTKMNTESSKDLSLEVNIIKSVLTSVCS
jgi:hypothetical protein